MTIQKEQITIKLENEDEVMDFWNIIAFALDWQAYAESNNKSKMTENELKMANKLYEITLQR